MKELQYNKGEVDSLWESDTLAKKKMQQICGVRLVSHVPLVYIHFLWVESQC